MGLIEMQGYYQKMVENNRGWWRSYGRERTGIDCSGVGAQPERVMMMMKMEMTVMMMIMATNERTEETGGE